MAVCVRLGRAAAIICCDGSIVGGRPLAALDVGPLNVLGRLFGRDGRNRGQCRGLRGSLDKSSRLPPGRHDGGRLPRAFAALGRQHLPVVELLGATLRGLGAALAGSSG